MHLSSHVGLLLCFWSITLGLPSSVYAQETPAHPEITLSATQMELSNAATIALDQSPPDTTTAIARLQEALRLGEGADLLYMSLGRAYQYDDQCASAEDAFKLAEAAPKVPQIPHEIILDKIARYRSESATLCSGTVTFLCDDPGIKLTLGQTTLVCNQTGRFQPGSYDVQITRSNKPIGQTTALVTGMEQEQVDISSMLLETIEARRDTAKPLVISGTITTAVGLGILGAGLFTATRLDNDLRNQNLSFEQAEARRRRRSVLYISGGVLSALGLGVASAGIVSRRRRAESEQGTHWTPSLHIDHRGAHASFTMRF